MNGDEKPNVIWGEGYSKPALYWPQQEEPYKVPDCTGKLLGVRLFKLDQKRFPWWKGPHVLRSFWHTYYWTPGKVEEAICTDPIRPDVAYPPCPPAAQTVSNVSWVAYHRCGMHAFYNHPLLRAHTNPTLEYDKGFLGVVSGWGPVEEYEHGFRSRYMRLEALVSNGVFSSIRLPYAASRYRVPMIPLGFLDEFMKEGVRGGYYVAPDPYSPEASEKGVG
ncbi:MAG: hypothetical protein M3P49_02135 [Actinomycetota bacterium]|nr:hypothetical protein [Actinomycetota bacterium]